MHTNNGEPCPECGELFNVRWLDSTSQGDSWECRECGHEWTIPVLSRAMGPRVVCLVPCPV